MTGWGSQGRESEEWTDQQTVVPQALDFTYILFTQEVQASHLGVSVSVVHGIEVYF